MFYSDKTQIFMLNVQYIELI